MTILAFAQHQAQIIQEQRQLMTAVTLEIQTTCADFSIDMMTTAIANQTQPLHTQIARCQVALCQSLTDAGMAYQQGKIDARTFIQLIKLVTAENEQSGGSLADTIKKAETQLITQSNQQIKPLVMTTPHGVSTRKTKLSREAVMIDNCAQIVTYLTHDAARLQTYMQNLLPAAFALYQANKMDFEVFTRLLDAATPENTAQHAAVNAIISQVKQALIRHVLHSIKTRANATFVAMDGVIASNLIETMLHADNHSIKLYNSLLDYFIHNADADAIHAVISDQDNRFSRLQSSEQLKRLIAVCNPQTAALLFIKAHEFHHVLTTEQTSIKDLQMTLLANPAFRATILRSNLSALQPAFARGAWQAEDFIKPPISDYKMGWLALSQANLIPKLLATGSLEDQLRTMQPDQLSSFFQNFPDKVLAFIHEEDLPLSTRKQLARRLLALDAAILGDKAYTFVKFGIFQLEDTYDLRTDPDQIYASQTIANVIAANWQGRLPWQVYVINATVNQDQETVTPQAFAFILSNVRILTHERLRKKDLALCVNKAGDYLTPTIFLACIQSMRTQCPHKMAQLLAILPDYLTAAKTLAPAELPAVLQLTKEFFKLFPQNEKTVNDPIIKALYANQDFTHKYSILGPVLFAKDRSADMARFFSQAAAYQLPPLIPASVIQGFRRGVLMGFCGYGLFMAVDKILDVINVANPLNGMKSAAGLGNAFTMLVGSLTAILTGGGIATTIAVIAAPVMVSALIGGLVGVLAHTGATGLLQVFNKISGKAYRLFKQLDEPNQQHYAILIHGLQLANAQHLRATLYAPDQAELRANVAKMLLQQEAFGHSLQQLPAEILAVITPLRDAYYHDNKNVMLKLADYTLGNLFTGATFMLHVLTLMTFNTIYRGPASRYFAYQKQMKLAGAVPEINQEALVKEKSQAQIVSVVLPSDPATAYQAESSNPKSFAVGETANTPPPAYSQTTPPARRLGAR